MFTLLFSGLFFLFLRVSGSGASFPAPLTKKEERDKVKDDFRIPFGKTLDELSLPFNVSEKFER